MSSQSFVQAGSLGRHTWPRTLGTLALMAVAGIGGALAVRAIGFPILRGELSEAPEPIVSGVLALMAGAIFACAMAGLFLGVRWLHGRSVRSLVSGSPQFRVGHLLLGFVLSAGLVVTTALALDPGSLKPLADVAPTVLLVSFAAMVVGFAIQAPAEEILFRGYLLQVGWRGFRTIWPAATISILLFALAHLGYNLESGLHSLTTAIGLTVVVLLLGGLEFSMGAHIGNNLVIAFLFQDLSDANADSTPGVNWGELAANLGVMLVFIAVAALLRRSSGDAARSAEQS